MLAYSDYWRGRGCNAKNIKKRSEWWGSRMYLFPFCWRQWLNEWKKMPFHSLIRSWYGYMHHAWVKRIVIQQVWQTEHAAHAYEPGFYTIMFGSVLFIVIILFMVTFIRWYATRNNTFPLPLDAFRLAYDFLLHVHSEYVQNCSSIFSSSDGPFTCRRY